MSRLEIQHTIINALQQLSDQQQARLIAFVNEMLNFNKHQRKKDKPPLQRLAIHVITDESFDFELPAISSALISKNVFTTTVQIGNIEKMKPNIHIL